MRMFDEINGLSEENMRSIPYDEYFDEMDLTDEEKEERKQFSREFEDVMLFIFSLFSVMNQYEYHNKQFITGQLRKRYSEIVSKFMDLDKYLEDYITQFSQETIDITIRHKDEKYYTSDDRAMLISENESHLAFSHKEFSDAVKSGKKFKRWMDIRDDRERKTHRKVGGTILPIKEPFVVGDSLMMHPKDSETYGAKAEEIVNCRCTAKYF